MLTEIEQRLLSAAKAVRQHAYAPYSDFQVGAAILGEDGSIYIGCNVENAAYPTGMCAERIALGAAISAGVRGIKAIAVVAGGPEVCTPCGACRQALVEFGADIKVIMANMKGEVATATLDELLPGSFGPGSLGRVGEGEGPQ